MLINNKNCIHLFSTALLVIGIQAAVADQPKISESQLKECKELGLSTCPQHLIKKYQTLQKC